MAMQRRAFTLVELVTVVLIVGIGMVIGYELLLGHWTAYEQQMIALNLQQDADRVLERLSADTRAANGFAIAPNAKQVVLRYPNPRPQVTYTLVAQPDPATGVIQNQVTHTVNGVVTILSRRLDLAASSFLALGNGLEVRLVFQDIFLRQVRFPIDTVIYPRSS